jgi:glutamate racemase
MLNMLRPDLQIEAIACPTFVPLIESRQLEGPAIETAVAATLPVLSEPTTVLLGCTHYPLIGELLKTRLGPHAHLIDPAHELATRIAGLSHTAPSSGVRTIPTRPRHRFYTTGDLPRFASLIDLILKPRKEYAIELQKI